jgi:hypothetical protein
VISPSDQNHPLRLRWFSDLGYDITKIPKPGSVPTKVAGVHAPRS